MEKDYKKLVSYLKAIGISMNPATFDGRVRIQKFAYMITKIMPGTLHYNFNFYLLGPYSTDLAKDYYHLKVENGYNLNQNELKNMDRIKELKDESTLELEIIASLLSIRESKCSEEEAEYRLMKIKPYLKLPDIEKAAEKAKKLGLID